MPYYKVAKLVLALLCLSISAALAAQETHSQEEQPALVELKIDLPVFDLPYQAHTMDAMNYSFFHTYSSLSMSQSLGIATGIYSSMHFGLMKVRANQSIPRSLRNGLYFGGTAGGILAFAYVLPFGYPWMSQEFQRAVLSSNGVPSRNAFFRSIGRGVTGATDEQLGRFKTDSPHDFIRMNASRSEGYILFGDKMMRNYFFYDPDVLSFVTPLVTTLINWYQTSVFVAHELGFMDIDDTISELNKHESNGSQTSRGITSGFPAIDWVYSLFRPDEPFAARGQHPSGDGSVARYITVAQLSDEEKSYLERQGLLSLLNFVSPLLYSIDSFPLGGRGLEGNFALRHYLTSFGSDVAASVFLKYRPFNMAFTFHSYQNHRNYFPAIEVELIDYPAAVAGLNFFFSPRILLGMQPKGQQFTTGSPEFLMLVGLRIDYEASRNLFPYIDWTVKTNGWVAGNEYLNASSSINMGLSLRF